jgi:glycosyltransferase involved in cell wall biosynthesis
MNVSVVIPMKNAAPYVGEAIESAAGQADVNETIVVDDHSTDNSVEIASQKVDHRVVVCVNSGEGVSAARNTGAALATGDWLLFLDADDRLRPGAVKHLLAKIEPAARSVVVYGDFDRINSRGRSIGIRRFFRNRSKPSGWVLRSIIRSFFLGNGGTSIVRAEAFSQAGGFDTRLRYCEDWHLWCRLATLGQFTYVPGACVLDYRLHEANTMQGSARTYRDYVPAIDSVFSDPLIASKLNTQELQLLRLQAETHLMTYSAGLDVRNHNYRKAFYYATRAAMRSPTRAPAVLARVALSAIWV